MTPQFDPTMNVYLPMAVSLAANVLTAIGTAALKRIMPNGLDKKARKAYNKALSRWTTDSVYRGYEKRNAEERLQELMALYADPDKEAHITDPMKLLMQYFIEEVQKDAELWRYFVGEEIKQLSVNIGQIGDTAEWIKQELLSRKLQYPEVVEALKSLLDRQINKNISSGKYIPDTFLEIGNLKDQYRYFCHPMLFSQLIFERAERMSFDYYDSRQRDLGAKELKYDVSGILKNPVSDFSEVYKICDALLGYMQNIEQNLSGRGYLGRNFSRKVDEYLKNLDYISKRIAIITEDAGRGKTNFICDLTSNFLLRNEIPVIYINGNQLDVKNLADSIAHQIFPTENRTLHEIFISMEDYCRAEGKPVVIVIDGLNECQMPNALQGEICTLLAELLKYDYVKTILTCRTIYYQSNFPQIEQQFKGLLVKTDTLYSHLHDEQKKRLFGNYLRYFKINAMFSENVEKKLVKNMLLLRIFCEAYEGRNLQFVHSIRKHEVFSLYYDKMKKAVLVVLGDQTMLNEYDVDNFFSLIAELMIARQQYEMIPVKDVYANIDYEKRKLFNQILDNNILIRIDPRLTGNGLEEGLNFTYDEFRDFLLAKYLTEEVWQKDQNKYTSFIEENTKANQQLAEGMAPFLYLMSVGDDAKQSVLKAQSWYSVIFDNYVWDVDPSKLTSEDVEFLKQRIPVDNRLYFINLICWGNWRKKTSEKLHAGLFYGYLDTLDDSQLIQCLDVILSRAVYKERATSERDKMVNTFEHMIDDDICKEEGFGRLALTYLYLSVSSEKSYKCYLRYMKQTGNTDDAQVVLANCNSTALRNRIKKMMTEL